MTFDFLELFNAVGAAQKVVTKDFIPAESLETAITEDITNLDSLDVTLNLFCAWRGLRHPRRRRTKRTVALRVCSC